MNKQEIEEAEILSRFVDFINRYGTQKGKELLDLAYTSITLKDLTLEPIFSEEEKEKIWQKIKGRLANPIKPKGG